MNQESCNHSTENEGSNIHTIGHDVRCDKCWKTWYDPKYATFKEMVESIYKEE